MVDVYVMRHGNSCANLFEQITRQESGQRLEREIAQIRKEPVEGNESEKKKKLWSVLAELGRKARIQNAKTRATVTKWREKAEKSFGIRDPSLTVLGQMQAIQAGRELAQDDKLLAALKEKKAIYFMSSQLTRAVETSVLFMLSFLQTLREKKQADLIDKVLKKKVFLMPFVGEGQPWLPSPLPENADRAFDSVKNSVKDMLAALSDLNFPEAQSSLLDATFMNPVPGHDRPQVRRFWEDKKSGLPAFLFQSADANQGNVAVFVTSHSRTMVREWLENKTARQNIGRQLLLQENERNASDKKMECASEKNGAIDLSTGVLLPRAMTNTAVIHGQLSPQSSWTLVYDPEFLSLQKKQKIRIRTRCLYSSSTPLSGTKQSCSRLPKTLLSRLPTR